MDSIWLLPYPLMKEQHKPKINMKKSNLNTFLVLFLITISIKSYGQYSELIAWTAPPQEFAFSLYRGVLDAVPPNQEKLTELASRINSDPSSRLDLFWIFVNSKEYQATTYAKQEKEYHVYYQYVTVGSTTKHSYYFATFPSGADMSLNGSYTFFVAAALRDYYAIYDENSTQYIQPTYADANYGGNSEEYCLSQYCPECDNSLVLMGVASDQACQDCLDKNQALISECMNGSNNSSYNEGTVTDRAGRSYKTVQIGNQVWMAENLAYEIPGKQITDRTRWNNNTAYDGWCYYNNDKTTYGHTYGVLYQWEAAKMACPAGWHLPSEEEWKTLENYLIANGYNFDGTTNGDKIAKAMAAKTYWEPHSKLGGPGNNPASNNSSGFSALPGGCRGYYAFDEISNSFICWSSSETSPTDAWYRNLSYNVFQFIRSNNYDKESGFSVRCIKD